MADQSMSESTLEELERLVQDEEFCQLYPARNQAAAAVVNEGASSTGTTPNDPLNTAFIHETTVHEQQSQISLSQPQSQTTKETASAIHGLLKTIVEQEHEIIDLCSPTKTTTTIPKTPTAMISTATMPRTPTMISTGTMPRTPTMASTGTMPMTPTMISTGTMPKTPTMISTGTMPMTPTMASTGTMPMTPTMASTGTMPETPTMASTTGTLPKTPTTIDLVSPTIETIDLCTPDTPTTNTGGHPHLPPPQ